MRGPIHIERENSDGDRGHIRTLDIEGLPSGTNQLEYIKTTVRETLDTVSDAYIVRAMTDEGRCIYRQRV